MENSNIYSFQDAYSSDSFEGSDWNDICTHVGLDLDIDGSSDTNEWNEIENEVEVVSASRSEKDEKVESEDNNETERKGELRAKMKELRKILKKAREHLSGKKNEDDLYDMYKSYKYRTRSVKKQFKNIIETDRITCQDIPDVELEDVEDGSGCELKSKRKKNADDGCKPSTSGVITTHSKSHISESGRGRKRCSDGLLASFTFHGKNRYNCTHCNFVGRSFGKVYSHMVKEHSAELLRCEKCSFTTANPMSLHNHTRLYCPQHDRD